jgi:hypothetical protein
MGRDRRAGRGREGRGARLALLGFESSDLIKVICYSISEMMFSMPLLQLNLGAGLVSL